MRDLLDRIGWTAVGTLGAFGIGLGTVGLTQSVAALVWIGGFLVTLGLIGTVWRIINPHVKTPAELSEAKSAKFWSGERGQIGVGKTPPFPESMPRWRRSVSWEDRVRVFTHVEWSPLGNPEGGHFPSTQNGSDLQKFLVRWRSVAEPSTVRAGEADPVDKVAQHVVGQEGWMILDGSHSPAFGFGSEPRGSTLLDVFVSVQQWVPAP